jgi:cell volume regulation protein A
MPPGTAPFTPVLSVAVAAIAFGLPEVVGGSGLLSVYVVALAIGNTPSPARRSLAVFHGGLAFIAQIALFVTLGLLVFPSELGGVAVPALLLTAVLIAVARPVATWLCTARLGFTRAERTLVAWSGLRGAVPIILATFVLSEGVGASDTIFNSVFFVVLVSAAIQGPLLQPLARRLGLAGEARAVYEPPLEIGAVGGADILEFSVGADDLPAGRRVRELGLPRTALLAVVLRAGEAIPPRGSTELEAGDRLYILTRADDLAEVERVIEGGRAAPDED